MKKRKFLVLTMVIAALTFAGCGNMSIGFGNFSFTKIHVDTYNNNRCFTVVKWYDNETGIEVETEEAGAMYFSEGQYMLIEDECPFCTETEADGEEEVELP